MYYWRTYVATTKGYYILKYLDMINRQRVYGFIHSVHTVNIYRYKAIGANATFSVILYTGKCISPCLEIL